MKLSSFEHATLFQAMQEFFNQLNIPVNTITENPVKPHKLLASKYKPDNPAHKLISLVYFLGMIDDAAFDGKGEAVPPESLMQDYEGLLVFGVELYERPNGLAPTRSQLAEITRSFNQEYRYMPVVVMFKYTIQSRLHLSFAACERLPYKQPWHEGEKTGRVFILKDIDIHQPHSGHLRILKDMAIVRTGKKAVNSFTELNNHWLAVFSVSLLNKEFYEELYNWYRWACSMVTFPKPVKETTDDHTHISIAVIRLLTRLIFTWFMKEKGLVPAALFEVDSLHGLLRNFQPDTVTSSDYYTAILQNLFFATFNTPMPDDAKDPSEMRRFISTERTSTGYTEDYLNHLVYRSQERFLDSAQALALFATIPFLNGGLFECLDRRDPTSNEEIRYDGFSTKPAKQPIVPNALFFSNNLTVEIRDNGEQDTKPQMVSVRGLIPMLNSYKFTVAENSPLELEIALDPELLGRVFENLLASYNPETQTTARKLTGSFYTPREIVDYMVDESLIAYLKSKLLEQPVVHEELGNSQLSLIGNQATTGQLPLVATRKAMTQKQAEALDTNLRRLFDVASPENPFADDSFTTNRLIEYLSTCRILDPACGSGAFPMGILHKMVFVLNKLDPQNLKWKQTQLRNAERDLAVAHEMLDQEIRTAAIASAEQRIAYIKESFDNPNHELDYTRKLFLIEHCIYGIDIQNIAIQISKLRFFISLMVEQTENADAENRGILSLPNLETKFVAANTLIGLNKTRNLLDVPEVRRLEAELSRIRQRIFFTRRYRDKMQLKHLELKKRDQLKDVLIHNRFEHATATIVAEWNPFDPVHSAAFFDVETMFGFSGGFDIVIGNPPYVRQEKIKHLKTTFKDSYTCYTGGADLYVYFYEKGFSLLNPNGILTYISSNKYFRSGYGEKLRAFLGTKATLMQVIDFGDAPVFDAIAYPSIVVLKKTPPPDNATARVFSWTPGPVITEFAGIFQASSFELPQKELRLDGWRLESKLALNLMEKLRTSGQKLEKFIDNKILYGIKTGLNEAFVVDAETKERLIAEHQSSAELLKPFLRGRDVKRWRIDYAGQYLIKIESSENKTHPWSGAYEDEAEKIFSRTYPAIYQHLAQFRDRLISRDDQGRFFWELRSCKYWGEFERPKIIYPDIAQSSEFTFDAGGTYLANTLYFIPTDNIALLGVLNSNSLYWYYTKTSAQIRGGFVRYFSQYVSCLPVFDDRHDLIANLVNQIRSNMAGNPSTFILPHESRLDAVVAHLYKLTEDEYTFILNDLKLPEPVRTACLNEYRSIARGGLE